MIQINILIKIMQAVLSSGSAHKVLQCKISNDFRQCCGSGLIIQDPGSEIFPSVIQGQKDPGSGSASKNLSI
jgi:hypothetical protein